MSLENICLFLQNTNETELANNVLDVFGKNAYSFDQFDEVSRVYFKIKNYEKCIEYGEKAYAIASTPEQMYIIRHNLINVYNHWNYPEKALRYIRANEAVLEKDIDRDFEKAFSLFLSNRKSEAASILREKILDDDLTEEQRIKTEFNLGTYDLIDGHFQQGLKRFLLAGEKMGIWDNTKTFITQPLETYGLKKWNFAIKPNMNLIVIAEAGIGDEIINIRFMSKLKDLGINAIWLGMSTRKELVEIFRNNGVQCIFSIEQLDKEFFNSAVYIPSMQLPIALNSSYETLWNGPYISQLDNFYQDKWNKVKGKIGIRWQGNPAYDQDLHRSIPLKDIIDIFPDTKKLISIQKDTGLEQLDNFPDLERLDNELNTLHDLFSCIHNLDLVITSCTSIAHIASSMGQKVCVIVPISCYYIWCNPTEKTPWYGENTKVFYQKTPRSWKEPLIELRQYLIQENFL